MCKMQVEITRSGGEVAGSSAGGGGKETLGKLPWGSRGEVWGHEGEFIGEGNCGGGLVVGCRGGNEGEQLEGERSFNTR